MTEDTINILWTSGWDSTFRMLYVALVEKKNVQPHYIVDEGRKSLQIEIKSMEAIRKALSDFDPEAAKRIRDTIFVYKSDIPEMPEITRKYRQLDSFKFGIQFEWLARYAESNGISNLEVGVMSRSFRNIPSLVAVERLDMRSSQITHMYIGVDSCDPYSIFKNFSFPILTMSKLDMGDVARRHGFAHIMEKTWFCHKPNKKGVACGFCSPCKDAVKAGLGRRVPQQPMLKRALNQFRDLIRKVKRRLRS